MLTGDNLFDRELEGILPGIRTHNIPFGKEFVHTLFDKQIAYNLLGMQIVSTQFDTKLANIHPDKQTHSTQFGKVSVRIQSGIQIGDNLIRTPFHNLFHSELAYILINTHLGTLIGIRTACKLQVGTLFLRTLFDIQTAYNPQFGTKTAYTLTDMLSAYNLFGTQIVNNLIGILIAYK